MVSPITTTVLVGGGVSGLRGVGGGALVDSVGAGGR